MSEHPVSRPDDDQPHHNGGTPPPPGYGPPPGYQPPYYAHPGYGWPAGSVPPGYGPAPQPQYPYGPQSGWYAGPSDPLVSPDFSGWWTRAFALLFAIWRPMVMVQLIWALPLVPLGVVVNLTPIETAVSANVDFTGDILVPLLTTLAVGLVTTLLTMVSQLATLQILVQHATGRPVSVSGALVTGLRRAPAMLGWGILAGLLTMVGLVFCFLPGLYVGAVMMVLPVVVLLERRNGIGRAFELFHADFGAAIGRIATIVGIMLAFGLVNGVLSSVLVTPGSLSGEGVNIGLALTAAIISAVFSIASSIVVSPLLLTAYADMRARHEPFATAHLAPAS